MMKCLYKIVLQAAAYDMLCCSVIYWLVCNYFTLKLNNIEINILKKSTGMQLLNVFSVDSP